MRKILMILPVLGALAGCDGTNMGLTNNQMIGTAGGAAIGALVTPVNPLQGAAIGGAVGLAAASLMGKDAAGACVYQRADGSRYTATCP